MSWREATQLIPRTTENEHQTGLGGDREEESRPKAASHNGVTCSWTFLENKENKWEKIIDAPQQAPWREEVA